MPDVYRADELHDGRSVRPLGGAFGLLHDGETKSSDGEVRTLSSYPSHTPRPSEKSIERLQRLLSEALASFSGQRQRLLASLKPGLVKMVVGIAEAVIQKELATDTGVIVRTVESALSELGRSGRINARVHTDDARILRDAIADGTWKPPNVVELEITPDSEICRGGCVLQSDGGQVDATIQTQLQQIERQLHAAVSGETTW
ncbi:MAG: FliH/SctL family protein [Armatimonadota bacterium]